MRIVPPVWFASVVLGCATPQQIPSEESGAAVAGAADSVEHGALGFVHEGDTTVIDEYTRTANTLEGVVRPQVPGAKFGWARYRVELGPSGDAQRAVLALGRRGTGPESLPSSRAESHRDGGTFDAVVAPPFRCLSRNASTCV